MTLSQTRSSRRDRGSSKLKNDRKRAASFRPPVTSSSPALIASSIDS